MPVARRIRVEDLRASESSETFEGHKHDANVSFFVNHPAPGSGPRLHRHPYEEVFIVQAGEATFTVGEQTIDAGAGDILVAPAGVPHKFVVRSEGYRSVNIHPVARMETEWLE
jgi:mannose-6-phosphate isomerase-like protein (cupin superfamily)